MNRRNNHRTPSPVDLQVSRRIRSARIDHQMSQEELANKLGITFQQVQKYEKGSNRVTIGRLVSIAAALERPVSFFLGSDSATEISTKPDPGLLLMQTRRGAQIAKSLLGAPPEFHDVFADLVAAVAKQTKVKVKERRRAA